ncbi:hypothetical protein OQA88_8645 [Cercophora sp. LCS_1]
MASPSVLVVGAGELGTAVLGALSNQGSRHGAKIGFLRRAESLSSSDPKKQEETKRLISLGAVPEAGDFVSSPIPDLVSVFKRYDVIIQCGGFGLPSGTQLRVTEAVLQAGVKRYFPWQFGVDYPAIGHGSAHELFDEMLEVRRQLRGQTATAWTIVSTGLFMSFLLLPDFGVVDLKKRVVRALGSWETRVTVTTPEDIGTMVAEMIYVPADTLNCVVYIGGDTISYGRLAGVLDEFYGAKFERQVWDLDSLACELRQEPGNVMLKYRNIFGAGVGVSWDMETTLNHQRGVSLTDVAEYVRKNKESLLVV